MLQRIPTDIINWIIVIGVILFVVELIFFNGGLIVGALLGLGLIYFGWKNFLQLWGKVCFWVGVILVIFCILNMLAVRFLILAAIAIFVFHYIKSKEESKKIRAELLIVDEHEREEVVEIQPFFSQKLWKEQRTNETVYAWRDVNIQGLYGDKIIDLSNTVLPEDTAVISIRQIFGNVTIYIPYEVDVSIHHSTFFGKAFIFGNPQKNLVNETVIYQTKDYDAERQRVKIICSLISGDIEVRRI